MMRAASDARPVSRILYGVAAADGHSSRPFITERLKRPTRKFGVSSRDAFWILLSGIPSLFGLAPCGVCHASSIAARAVRSYRTFSPLPLQLKGSATACACFALAPGSRRTALTVRLTLQSNISGPAGLRLPGLCVRLKSELAFAIHLCAAVYSLWHW